MSKYSDFPIDFLIRTQDNLRKYSGDYEVTNLINNCLGLIVIPKELLIDNLPDYSFSDSDSKYGISKKNIKFEHRNNYSLRNVLRHIRNGLSHGKVEQESSHDMITGIRIYDSLNNNSPENFSIEFTINELYNFAISISNEFIN